MKKDNAKARQYRKKTEPAFALVELVLSIALIGFLTLAVGLAMSRLHSRSDRTKTSLASLQKKNDVFQTLAEEIRYASQLHMITSDILLLSAPHDGGTRRVGYHWNLTTRIISRKYEYEPLVTLLKGVYYFNVDYDSYWSEGIPYIRGVEITIQIGSPDENYAKRYIEFVNNPKWPGY